MVDFLLALCMFLTAELIVWMIKAGINRLNHPKYKAPKGKKKRRKSERCDINPFYLYKFDTKPSNIYTPKKNHGHNSWR